MSMATVALKALYEVLPRMSPRQSVDVFWLFCFSVSGGISGPLGGVNWTSGHSGWAVARSSVQLQDLWGFASAEGPPRGAGDDAARCRGAQGLSLNCRWCSAGDGPSLQPYYCGDVFFTVTRPGFLAVISSDSWAAVHSERSMESQPTCSQPFFWVNYNDLTVLPHWKPRLIRGIIPKWP